MNLFVKPVFAQLKTIKNIEWNIAAQLPDINVSEKQLGLAGLIGGIHNNILLMAGGSNFPNGMPWDGGKKKYWNNIYALIKNGETYTCTLLADTLKQPIAYSSSVSTPNGIICIGGENDNGIQKDVFLLQWDIKTKQVDIKPLPSLPIALTNASATAIGNTVYIAGGEEAKNASNSFFSIDLNAQNPSWQTLSVLPIALSHAAVVAQSNGKETCVYVIGGRTKTASGISELHGTVFCYKPSNNTWKTLSSLKENNKPAHLSTATAVAINSNEIIVIGGDDGKIFTQLETINAAITNTLNENEKARLKEKKLRIINHHPGFNTSVRLYNTITDTWKSLNNLPYSPVTTFAAKQNNLIFIPGGEIQPGIRTANILMGEIKSKK